MPAPDTDILYNVFDKYKLTKPIPAPVQAQFFAARERILIKTLKEIGKYSILSFLGIKLLFKVMSWGVKLSFFQAKIVVLTGLFISSGIISSGGYITYKYIEKKIHPLPKKEIKTDKSIAPPNAINKKITGPIDKISSTQKTKKTYKKSLPKIPRLNISYNIGIKTLANKNSNHLYNNMNNLIQENFKKIDPAHIFNLDKSNNQKVSLLLTGSINKNGKNNTISLKLINVKTSDIVWGTLIKFSVNNKDEACHKLLLQFADFLKENN